MEKLRLRLLGDSVIEIGQNRILPSATHLFSLLLFAGIERGRRVTRPELIAHLFPKSAAPAANHGLRQLLYRIRRLGAPVMVSASAIWLDPNLVEEDIQDILSRSSLPEEYQRPGGLRILLPYLPPNATLSRWLENYRDRVRPELIRLLDRELRAVRARADWQQVQKLAGALSDIDPFNETATLCTAEALARLGSKKDALALLRRFEKEVGKSAGTLELPPRLLARRIVESQGPEAGPPEPPMIGRERELERLSASWARAVTGRFTCVMICGTESIGKSRLATEFATAVRLQGTAPVIFTKRECADRDRPFSLFADIANQLLTLRGAAGCSPDSMAFISRLATNAAVVDGSNVERRDVQYTQSIVRHAIVDLLDSVLVERPLLFVVDDADHLDSYSRSLLCEIERLLHLRPCLLVLIGNDLQGEPIPSASRLRLGALGPAQAKRLSSSLNGLLAKPLSDEVLEHSENLAAGNPGHLRMLLLHRASGAHADDIPKDLVAALDERLHRITAEALHVLQACALFRAPCPPSVLSHLTGLREYSLLQGLQELEDNMLVVHGQGGLECASNLVHDRVVATTTPAVAALLHHRAARWLKGRASAGSVTQALAWRIAEHYSKGGDADSALEWKRRCWQQWISLGLPNNAVSSIKASLSTAVTADERAGLLTALAAALRALGSFVELEQVLAERAALSDHIGDDARTRSDISFDLLEATTTDSLDLRRTFSLLEMHLRDEGLDVLRRLRAARLLMVAADHWFDVDTARGLVRAIEDIRPSELPLQVLKLHSLLIYQTTFGTREEAERLLNILDGLIPRLEPSWLRMSTEIARVIAGRVVKAGPLSYGALERAFEECKRYGAPRTAFHISTLLTACYVDDGDLDQARRWARVAEVLATENVGILFADHMVGQIDVALADQNYSKADALLTALGPRRPNMHGPRMTREHLVYKVKVDQLCGRGTTDEDFAELCDLHRLAQAFGRHDDNAEVLWVALVERGQSEQASSMLADYLTSFRRERRRCNYFLRTRTACDPIWRRTEFAHWR